MNLLRREIANGRTASGQDPLVETSSLNVDLEAHNRKSYEEAATDNTDGIGSIEFTDMPNTAYFGEIR